MSVQNGQPVNKAVTDAGFLSRLTDSDTVAKVGLKNTSDVNSGAVINNAQRAINKALEGVGAASESDATVNDYSSNNYITDGDNRKVAIEKLDEQLFTTQTQLSALDAINSQDVTAAAVGSTPNANGFTVGINQVVNLEPASASFGGAVTTTAQTFAGDKTFQNNVIVSGDLTVNGTTTTINSATVDTLDPNITVNKTGNDAAAEGSGLTVDRTGTKGSFIYKAASASRFAIGDLGGETDAVSTGATQTLINKTLTSPTINTPTGLTKSDVGLGNVDDTSDSTKNSATATLTNKTISGSNNTITNVSLSTGVTGTLPETNGGTGQSTYATGDILYASSSSAISKLSAGTNGHVLTLASGIPSWAPASGGSANALYSHYESQTGQSIPNAAVTIINYATLVEQSSSLVTTGSNWKFTSNATMRVFIHASAILNASTGWVDTETLELAIYKNGSFYKYIDYKMSFGSGSNVNIMVNGGTFVSLVNTDFIDVRITQNSGDAITLVSSAGFNHVSIFRVD